jgi:hypothetical protein
MCFCTWLANPDSIFTPDISHVPREQHAMVAQALREQSIIGWDLGVRGYISKHWVKAIAANANLSADTNRNEIEIGNTWARKTIHQLWEFGREMWHDRNKILHDSSNEDTKMMKSATIDAEIAKLYARTVTYAAEDRQFLYAFGPTLTKTITRKEAVAFSGKSPSICLNEQ